MAFAMITLIKDAQTQGCDATEIIKLCEEHYVLPKLIGIEAQTKIYSKIKGAAKSILGDKMIKQILKIRVR